MVEGISYEQALTFAHSWGAVYFILMFVAACAYALWPSNKSTFREAASMPLRDDDGMP